MSSLSERPLGNGFFSLSQVILPLCVSLGSIVFTCHNEDVKKDLAVGDKKKLHTHRNEKKTARKHERGVEGIFFLVVSWSFSTLLKPPLYFIQFPFQIFTPLEQNWKKLKVGGELRKTTWKKNGSCTTGICCIIQTFFFVSNSNFLKQKKYYTKVGYFSRHYGELGWTLHKKNDLSTEDRRGSTSLFLLLYLCFDCLEILSGINFL